MNSLEIIPIRTDNQINWEKIDKQINFPQLFKVFNDTYLIDQLFNTNKTSFLDQEKIKSLGMFQLKKKPSLVIDSFFNPAQIPNQIEILLDKEDEIDQEILKSGLIPFAYSSSEELLMIGTQGKYIDKIYLFTRWNESPLELLANDIFDFFKNFFLNVEETYLGNRSLHKLHKNYGEDFWRIKN